jgi:hypothetical protein
MATKRNEAAAEWVPIGTLKPWADNPRHNQEAVALVAESIKRFGFASPIIARTEDQMVIAGHTRLKAATELGLDKVPVRYLDLDPADARMLALADNKTSEVAAWDEVKLAELLGAMTSDELDVLTATGWDNAELDALMGNWGDPFGDEHDDRDDVDAIHDAGVAKIVIEVPVNEGTRISEVLRAALNDAGVTFTLGVS